jgi:cell division protein FtsN
MDPIEKTERKQEAQRRLRAQRRRVGQLRSRVVAISLISFVLLWGVVFAQMVAGNDPVLGAGPQTTAPKIASETIETSAPEEVEAEVVEPEPPEEAVEIEPEPEPEPVTTSQS